MRWFQRALGIAYVATVCGSGTTWAQNANFHRYLTRGVLTLIAAVSAPQGSLVTTVDLEAYDLRPPR